MLCNYVINTNIILFNIYIFKLTVDLTIVKYELPIFAPLFYSFMN
jgi:hypothetical protein